MTTRWEFPKATVTVAPERARVLQVTVGDHDAYWTDDAADGWNVGGDRLWLGPEWAWYWTDLSSYDVATHVVPDAVEPREWATEGTAARHEVTLRHLHSGDDVRAWVSRTFDRVDPAVLPYPAGAAYRATASLDLLDPPTGAMVSLWTMVQVPPGGEVVVPGGPMPRDFFDPAPAGTWRHDGTALRATLGGPALFKLGVAPTAGVDRYAYVRAVRDGYLVVARHVDVEPDARYADVPLADRDSQGDAVQFFCDGGSLGAFSEVEHHSPAATAYRCHVTDVSLVTVSLVDDIDAWYRAWLAADITPGGPSSPR